jgi:hypothetical protein
MMTTKTEEIGQANETVLQLPGVVATRTTLVVFDSATEQQLQKAFSQIAKMNVSLVWWLGDLGIALQARKQKQLAKEAAALRVRANECTTDDAGMEAKRQLLERANKIETTGVIEYTRDLCAAHNISEGYVKNCVMLARFYEPSFRNDGLLPQHHIVAMVAVGGSKGDPEKAKVWLAEAKEQDLTASELRKRVNIAKIPVSGPEAPAEPHAFEEMDAADAWAVRFKEEAGNLEHEQAEKLLTRWQAIRELLTLLETRAHETAA